MKIAFQTAVAGLNVASSRLNVAASNIVNAQSGGQRDPYDGYAPVQHVQSTGPHGAPVAGTKPVTPASVPAYQPNHPDADADGLIGLPNTDLAANIVELKIAEHAYKANIVTIRTADELSKELIDTLA